MAFRSWMAAPTGGMIHVCLYGLQRCREQYADRATLHVNVFRRRYLATIAEPWAHGLPPLPQAAAKKELFKGDADVTDDFERHWGEPRLKLLAARESRGSGEERLADSAERPSCLHRRRRRHRGPRSSSCAALSRRRRGREERLGGRSRLLRVHLRRAHRPDRPRRANRGPARVCFVAAVLQGSLSSPGLGSRAAGRQAPSACRPDTTRSLSMPLPQAQSWRPSAWVLGADR